MTVNLVMMGGGDDVRRVREHENRDEERRRRWYGRSEVGSLREVKYCVFLETRVFRTDVVDVLHHDFQGREHVERLPHSSLPT